MHTLFEVANESKVDYKWFEKKTNTPFKPIHGCVFSMNRTLNYTQTIVQQPRNMRQISANHPKSVLKPVCVQQYSSAIITILLMHI
jgi:hypothetical protein